MRDNLNDIVAGLILFLGMFLMIGGLLLYMGGSKLPTREIIAAGFIMVSGIVLYAQIRSEEDDI